MGNLMWHSWIRLIKTLPVTVGLRVSHSMTPDSLKGLSELGVNDESNQVTFLDGTENYFTSRAVTGKAWC